MSRPILTLHSQGTNTTVPAVTLEQRRAELLAERDDCDKTISAVRARRSNAVIDGRFAEADQLDAELTAALTKRTRLEDGLARIRERIEEQRAEHARQERIKHNAEMSRRIEALAPKLKSFERAADSLGTLGREIGRDVEAIHRLGMGYLTVDEAVLHRLRASLHGVVAISVDLPLGRDVPIHIVSETGRNEWLAVHAPSQVIAEARRNYLMHDPTPPEAA